MALKEGTVVYEKGEIRIELLVGEASVLMGMRRTRLRMEGRRAEEEDPDRALLRVFSYPDMLAATKTAEGIPWPLGFEEFLALPEGLLVMWEEAVYELNPNWLITDQVGGDEEQTKKVAQSSTDD